MSDDDDDGDNGDDAGSCHDPDDEEADQNAYAHAAYDVHGDGDTTAMTTFVVVPPMVTALATMILMTAILMTTMIINTTTLIFMMLTRRHAGTITLALRCPMLPCAARRGGPADVWPTLRSQTPTLHSRPCALAKLCMHHALCPCVETPSARHGVCDGPRARAHVQA